MTTQNLIEEALDEIRWYLAEGTNTDDVAEIHDTLNTMLQSFARKVVEEGKKINDEYIYKHEYPTAPLLALLDRIRSSSGLSGEDNQP